jgi:hypothetical protein
VKSGTDYILIDTGIGLHVPGMAGALPQKLASIGVEPEEISKIFITASACGPYRRRVRASNRVAAFSKCNYLYSGSRGHFLEEPGSQLPQEKRSAGVRRAHGANRAKRN